MYNMEFDRPTTKPVVPSHASASAEFGQWVRQNSYDQLTDGSGLVWNVITELRTLPDPTDLKKSVWSIEINVAAEATVDDLYRTGTLSTTSESDVRLAELLEERKVPLRIKSVKHEGASLEDLRNFASEVLPKLKVHLRSQTFHDLKRQRAAVVVNETRMLGGVSGEVLG